MGAQEGVWPLSLGQRIIPLGHGPVGDPKRSPLSLRSAARDFLAGEEPACNREGRIPPHFPPAAATTTFLQVNLGPMHWEQKGGLRLSDSLEISGKASPLPEADHQVAALPQPPPHHPSV